MIILILGILLLVWPISAIPQLLKNKKQKGYYFDADKRIIIPKYMNAGNSLNTKNKYAFGINVFLGILLVVRGLMELLH